MADPISMVAIGSTIIGGVTSAAGSIMGGNAQQQMYQYQADVAQMNAKIAQQNANYAIFSGEMNAQEAGMKARFQRGTTIAQQGAGGLAVHAGSQAQVESSDIALGQQDQALIRANAQRAAYGYEVQGAQATAQGQVDIMAGQQAQTAGEIGAFSSLLGTAGSVSSKWLAMDKAFGDQGPSSAVKGLLTG